MRILIDTNVIIDYLCNRHPFAECANEIFKLSEAKVIDAFISSISIPNIIYILRKELNKEKINQIIDIIYMMFDVYDIDSYDLKDAAKLDFDDYEDALQSISAIKIKADYIVTRNCKDFYNSRVKAITPYDFLSIYNF